MTKNRSRPIEISSKKVEELSNLFRMVSEEPMSSHLSDDQFTGYVTGDLSEEQMIEIDRHLDRCEECGAKIEYLARRAMAWSGSKAKARSNYLRNRVLSHLSEQHADAFSLLEELRRQIRSLLLGTNLALGMVQAATEEKKSFLQGDQWICYLDIDRHGNYILRISSHNLTLEGTHLRLVSRDWQREITLIRVDENQIGAKVVLSPEDLKKFPEGQDFSVEMIRQGPDAK